MKLVGRATILKKNKGDKSTYLTLVDFSTSSTFQISSKEDVKAEPGQQVDINGDLFVGLSNPRVGKDGQPYGGGLYLSLPAGGIVPVKV